MKAESEESRKRVLQLAAELVRAPNLDTEDILAVRLQRALRLYTWKRLEKATQSECLRMQSFLEKRE